ncbi:hypothetical protein GCM10027578_32430 [Spirosoma luteolum]
MKTTNQLSHTANRPAPGVSADLITFVSKRTSIFEALTRLSTPFGGNWLPPVSTTQTQVAAATGESLAQVQAQLDSLQQLIGRLNEQVRTLQHDVQRATDATTPHAPQPPIGIHRFHTQDTTTN